MNGVITSASSGVASNETPCTENETSIRTIRGDGFDHVFGAGGEEATIGRHEVGNVLAVEGKNRKHSGRS